MPRPERAKGSMISYTQEQFRAALKDVQRGLTLDNAATRNGVPKSTLGKHVKNAKFPRLGRRPILSEEDENILAEYLRIKAIYGEGLTRREVKLMVKEFVKAADIKHPWGENLPGDDWFNGFMKRHPKLVPRKAEGMASYRVAGCDPFTIHQFFSELQKLYDAEGISGLADAWRLYNCDETYFNHDPQDVTVISPKGLKRVSKNVAGSGRENTTVLACGGADGTKLPPLIVFSGTYVWNSWVPDDNEYPGTAYTASKKGWMEGTLFCHWFEHVFLENVKPKNERDHKKLILFFDGAKCHINPRMIRKAIENDVILVKFPPNVTQYLQPLDLCVFKPMKDEWNKNLTDFNRENSIKAIDKSNFSSLLRCTWEDGFKSKNLRSGFRATGLLPLDFKKFPESAYSTDKLARFKETNGLPEAPVENPPDAQVENPPEAQGKNPPEAQVENPPEDQGAPVINQGIGMDIDRDHVEDAEMNHDTPVIQDLPEVQDSATNQNTATTQDTAVNQHKTLNKDITTNQETHTKQSTNTSDPDKPSTSGVSRRLSFEDFVRKSLDLNNKSKVATAVVPAKRKKISQSKGEILTSRAVLKRIENEEKEKQDKQIEKEERAKKREEEKLKKIEQKEQKAREREKKKQEREQEKENKRQEREKKQMQRKLAKELRAKNKVKNKKQKSELSSSSDSEYSEPTLSDSDQDPETFSDLERDIHEIENEDETLGGNEDIDIRLELYYAVFYDLTWYVGRVIDFFDEDTSKIKFLKNDLDKFVWPKTDDIQTVKNEFIFYGPLTLKGTGPFELSRSDMVSIKSKFLAMKR